MLIDAIENAKIFKFLMQQSSTLTSRQQEEIKQMIECALIGFRASISHELNLLTQLLQPVVPEKGSQLIHESPICDIQEKNKEFPSITTKAPQQTPKESATPITEEDKKCTEKVAEAPELVPSEAKQVVNTPPEAEPAKIETAHTTNLKAEATSKKDPKGASDKNKTLHQPRWEHGNKKFPAAPINKMKAKTELKQQTGKKGTTTKQTEQQQHEEAKVEQNVAEESKPSAAEIITNSINATEISKPDSKPIEQRGSSAKKGDKIAAKRMPPKGQQETAQKRSAVQS